MPTPVSTPNSLRPFETHGLDLRDTPSGEAIGDCPWCDSDGKFSVNMESGQWRCFSCKSTGNSLTFLQKIHDLSHNGSDDYEELRIHRKLLYSETLYKWGVCQSALTHEWIVPAYNGEGNLSQLYRYVHDRRRNKMVMYGTPKLRPDEHDISVGLFGAHLFIDERPDVYLVEGVWDAMALWEVIGTKCNVLAVPGFNVFFDSWVPKYFKGKRVTIIFDNDHPKINKQSGQLDEPGGFSGTKRTAGILKGVSSASRPESIKYLRWGPDGWDSQLADGYDLRDYITDTSPQDTDEEVTLKDREARIKTLLTKVEAIPDAWPSVKMGSEELTSLHCNSYKDLLNAWEKAMNMTPGLRKGLVVLLAASISTELIGEQLWVRLMGPPSSGKTTLCEALTVAKKYVKAVSTFTGFHSGYKTDKEGEEDYSLIPHIIGKTFIIKDGDTLLKAGNRELIMAEFRDIFDGTSRSHYRHGLQREYDNIRVTVVLSGTSNLRELDASECGGRFIDVIVMEGIDIKQERNTMLFLLDKTWKNIGSEVNGKAETRDDVDKIRAKRMTGGYVNYIRERAGKLVKAVSIDPKYRGVVADCGVLVAYMRARPSETQREISEREFGGRLVIQYGRLTACIAAVMGKTEVDEEIVSMVRQIALDTCRGRTLEICRLLWDKGDEGTSFETIMRGRGGKEDDLKEYMRFLKDTKVIETFELGGSPHMRGPVRHRLSKHVRELYSRVVMEN